MSFSSTSWMWSLRATAFETRKSDSTSWPSPSLRILSAPFFFSYSTYTTGLMKCSRFKTRKRFSHRKPVNIEYEKKNGADKILKEGEGHDVESDFLDSNA